MTGNDPSQGSHSPTNRRQKPSAESDRLLTRFAVLSVSSSEGTLSDGTNRETIRNPPIWGVHLLFLDKPVCFCVRILHRIRCALIPIPNHKRQAKDYSTGTHVIFQRQEPRKPRDISPKERPSLTAQAARFNQHREQHGMPTLGFSLNTQRGLHHCEKLPGEHHTVASPRSAPAVECGLPSTCRDDFN